VPSPHASFAGTHSTCALCGCCVVALCLSSAVSVKIS
jgi:hypothetical protein